MLRVGKKKNDDDIAVFTAIAEGEVKEKKNN